MREFSVKQKIIGKTLLLCGFILLIFCSVALCNERNILVLHSYDPEYIYTRVFNNTLKEELDKSGSSVNLFMSILIRKGLTLQFIMVSLKNILCLNIKPQNRLYPLLRRRCPAVFINGKKGPGKFI